MPPRTALTALSRLSLLHRQLQLAPPLTAASKSAPGRNFSMSSSPQQQQQFDISPVPPKKHVVRTAACLIIGDEVLNGQFHFFAMSEHATAADLSRLSRLSDPHILTFGGSGKTRDSNSNFLAKFLFDLAIDLKRIEVIADEEDEIVEAVQRMAKNYDLVITSGGIGATHDDVTYENIAKAFNTTLQYDEETKKRMVALSKRRYNMDEQTEAQKLARDRMALFPVPTSSTNVEVLFVDKELWVPVVRVADKVCILPGVPMLFERLLTGLGSRYINLPPSSEKPHRVLVHTTMPESSIAPFLTDLQEMVKQENIRVGSYPKFDKGVDVSLIGKDQARLKELAEEVIKELKGEIVSEGKLGEDK